MKERWQEGNDKRNKKWKLERKKGKEERRKKT